MRLHSETLIAHDGEQIKLNLTTVGKPPLLVALTMMPEQRLFLTVLLDALATMKDGERERYLMSEDFDEVCKCAGVVPRFARLVNRSTAKRALAAIRSAGQPYEKTIEELYDERQEEQE